MTGRNQKLGKPRNVRLGIKNCEAVDQLVRASGGEETDSDVLRRIVAAGLKVLVQNAAETQDAERRSEDISRDSAALARIEKLLLEMRADRLETRDEVTRNAALASASKLPTNVASSQGKAGLDAVADDSGVPTVLLEDRSLSPTVVAPDLEKPTGLTVERAAAGERLLWVEPSVASLPPGALPESMFNPDTDYEWVEGDDDDEAEAVTKSLNPEGENILDLRQ